ncbi:MAG: multifunctional oxoglutarate decarboxylase/oxoglutarate dehydrogenase thiamine pyrophosphate-binding subunit/dihydrolipoyllysine-residue succinyltransferase subunit [Acidimicrobiia bacterium]
MTFDQTGANEGLIEDLYADYLENPALVPEAWRDYFAGQPTGNGPGAATSPAPTPATAPPAASTTPAPAPTGDAPPPPVVDARQTLRGASARIAENMALSLAVPTATSVRTVPAKLLSVNRQILNNHLGRTGRGKVSFTHLIAFAVARALREFPNLNSHYEEVDGSPTVVRHEHVNLGLAVDLEKSDGSRTLVVPNIQQVETLDFAGFWEAYEALIVRVRAGQISPDDFAGTTATITNPGMIGTVHSVPRLMPGQGFIVGVGAIGFPSEYEGADPQALANLGVSTVTTLTNTYDHRIIGGAESGEFLRRIHALLLGEDSFYDDAFQSLKVPYEPARWVVDHAALDEADAHEKVVHVHQLINMYRVRGHLMANLDPLSRREPRTHPELDITHYGLSIWDLDREFPTGSLGGGSQRRRLPLREILGMLRDAYARTVGVEYMHIQEFDQKEWIQRHVEHPVEEPAHEEKRRILERLNAAEAFERFVHTKYLGQKRFSLEGAETLIPMLDALNSAAADTGIAEVVMGMAHRGRLNVLASVLGKSYSQIFREFEGELDPASTQGSGDVKYHLGATGKHLSPNGRSVALTLAANPSHLEAVDPVVEGMARAKGDLQGDVSGAAVLPVLIHGDAAFAGQGVVAETFNLSEVEGYDVGGTVHIVVNNQLGFTTSPEAGRSSVYATDVAKMVQAPIFHVNGDDPEAAVRVIRLAFAFRQEFQKDVVVDLVCYRRYGHNESDEPAFTQPKMYSLIAERPSIRDLYTNQLVAKGDLSAEECEAAVADFRSRLDQAFEETHAPHETGIDGLGSALDAPEPASGDSSASTAVTAEALRTIVDRLTTFPEGFEVHPKLERVLLTGRATFDGGEVDWALAEACAFGTMLLEGTPVRLAGQDTRRGTFSQRHATLVDHRTEDEYSPLAHLSPDQAPLRLYDSVLSEYAALGFEYGYSVADPASFVAWEAQFGDFANGAQIIVDQFLVAAEDKWGQRSALTLLLPHGFEGQGPEHSSARLERFLALCGEDNLRVVYPSTAAQYFHVLRRQARAAHRVPLICFTPKRYLRMPQSRSPIGELTGGTFEAVLDDRAGSSLARQNVARVLLCAGKLGHELMDVRDERNANVAVVRVEQLYPWPETALVDALAGYPNATEVWWVQEEPANMGAWNYVHGKLLRLTRPRGADLRHIARRASPSPATGSHMVHEREQAELLATALSSPG